MAGWAALVTVSPTRACRTSLTPVIRYPTSPAARPSLGVGSGEITPTSSVSCAVPVDIIRLRWRLESRPSITLM